MTRSSAHLTLISAVSLYALFSNSFSAHASQSPLPEDVLKSLAKNFVERLDPVYEELKKDGDNISNTPRSIIADGSDLLLRPRVGSILFDADIFSFQQDGLIYMSLADVIFVFNFPIEFDNETGLGEGWFLREDWYIAFDLQQNSVVSRGKEIPVLPQDIIERDGEYFINSNALRSWMELSFTFDFGLLYADVATPHPIAAVARISRRTRNEGLAAFDNEPEFPRTPQPRKALDLASVNVNQRVNFTRVGSNKETVIRDTSSIRALGQVAYHDAQISTNRDNRDGFDSVLARFSRRSETNDLLGSLNATFYEFGDISGTGVPLSGGGTAALGARVTNNQNLRTDFTRTVIEGISLPDWDVELYRNGILIETQTVGITGEYRFTDVSLFSGDNEFEILFYGPQGELRQEELNIPVSPDIIAAQDGIYDVSLTFDGEQTYLNDSNTSEQETKGKPDFAATYSKNILGQNVFLGLRSRPILDGRRSFVTTGTSFFVNEALFDVRAGIDDQGELAGELDARRQWNDWDLSAGMRLETDRYGRVAEGNNTVFSSELQAQRDFEDVFNLDSFKLLFGAGYDRLASGESRYRGDFSNSIAYAGYNLNQSLFYEGFNYDIEEDDDMGYSVTLRKNYGRANARGGLSYRIKPESVVTRYFAQLGYSFGQNRSLDFFWDYEPETEFTVTRLNATYQNDYFRTTPFIEYNSEDDLRAGMNVNFNLVNVPGRNLPEITSGTLTGRGMLHAFVYLDKEGNFRYDEGVDEPLEGVMVQSVNSRRSDETDEHGRVTLVNLPAGLPTDIELVEDTLPDFLMLSARSGRSILPLSGQRHDFDFPVHLAGEIDGTMRITTKEGFKRAFGNLRLNLIPLDANPNDVRNTVVAFDGFYLFDKVPPGRYIIIPNTPRNKTGRGNPIPRMVQITYEGDILAETDIMLRQDRGFVEYEVQSDLADLEYADLSAELAYDYTLLVQSERKSGLGQLLSGFMNQFYGRSVLSQLTKMDQSPADGFKAYKGSHEQLHNACSILSDRKINCKIKMQVIALDPAETDVAETDQQEGGNKI